MEGAIEHNYLKQLALVLARLVPHGASIERVFSTMGWIHSAVRNSLAVETTGMLTALRMDLQQRAQEVRAQQPVRPRKSRGAATSAAAASEVASSAAPAASAGRSVLRAAEAPFAGLPVPDETDEAEPSTTMDPLVAGFTVALQEADAAQQEPGSTPAQLEAALQRLHAYVSAVDAASAACPPRVLTFTELLMSPWDSYDMQSALADPTALFAAPAPTVVLMRRATDIFSTADVLKKMQQQQKEPQLPQPQLLPPSGAPMGQPHPWATMQQPAAAGAQTVMQQLQAAAQAGGPLQQGTAPMQEWQPGADVLPASARPSGLRPPGPDMPAPECSHCSYRGMETVTCRACKCSLHWICASLRGGRKADQEGEKGNGPYFCAACCPPGNVRTR